MWSGIDAFWDERYWHTALVWTPTIIVFLLTPFQVAKTFDRRPNPIPWIKTVQTKLALSCILVADSLVLFGVAIYETLFYGLPYPVDFFYPLVLSMPMIVLTACIISCRNYGFVTSGTLFISWLVFTICGVPEFVYWIHRIATFPESWNLLDYPRCIGALIWFTCCALEAYLHCFADKPPVEFNVLNAPRKPSPEMSSSCLSRITIWWFTSMYRLGVQKPLEISDLYSLNAGDTSNVLVPKWYKLWDRQNKKSKKIRDHQEHSLDDANPLLEEGDYYKSFLTSSIHHLVLFPDVHMGCAPRHSLIRFTEHLDRSMWQGVASAVTMFFSAELSSVFLSHYFYLMYRIGTRVQSCLTAAVYRKTLRWSNSARREKTVGETVNLMAIDIDRFEQITPQTMQFFLYHQLGVSVVSGVIVMVLLLTINFGITIIIRKWQMAEKKEERIKMGSEVLNGIKVTNLYAWEPLMEKVIEELKEKELGLIKKASFLRTFLDMLNSASPFLVALSTFVTFIYIDRNNVLTPEIAFVSLTLLNQLSSPMSQIAKLITQSVQVALSNKRLREFMMSEELNSDAIDHNARDNNDVISVKNATLSWESARNHLMPNRNNINLTVYRRQLVTIVERIGSGKSSLLQAMIGEMEKLTGSIAMHGRLCYVPQQSWMQNNFVHQNILFEKQFNDYFYSRVLTCCALKRDLQILPKGDSTEIGEKGINLSGGQKFQRYLASWTVAVLRVPWQFQSNSVADSPQMCLRRLQLFPPLQLNQLHQKLVN